MHSKPIIHVFNTHCFQMFLKHLLRQCLCEWICNIIGKGNLCYCYITSLYNITYQAIFTCNMFCPLMSPWFYCICNSPTIVTIDSNGWLNRRNNLAVQWAPINDWQFANEDANLASTGLLGISSMCLCYMFHFYTLVVSNIFFYLIKSIWLFTACLH